MGHRYASHVVGIGDYLRSEAVALGAHDDGEPLYGVKLRIVDRHGVVGKRHSSGGKSHFAQVGSGMVNPRPRHQEHRPHRHAYATTVERVARGAGKHHAVYAKSRRRPEYRPDIGGVGHTVDYHKPPCILADLRHRRGGLTSHRAQHAAGQLVARYRGERGPTARIHFHVRCPSNNSRGVALDMFLLAKHRHRLISGVERHVYHLGALGDEEGFGGVQPVAQLGLG